MPRNFQENQESTMQKFRTCFFIATCLCLSQQAAFADEAVDTTISPPIEEGVDTINPSSIDVGGVDTTMTRPVEGSDTSDPQTEYYSTTDIDDTSSTAKDVLSELIIRPVAVIGSVTGLAIFVIASPVSGLASIPEPHDAFKTTWDDFVVTPYHFAFRRPLGDYSVELN